MDLKESREEQNQLGNDNVEALSKKNPITVASLLEELRKNGSPQINYEAVQNAIGILDSLEKNKDVKAHNDSLHDIEEER